MQRSGLDPDTVFALSHPRIIHETLDGDDTLIIDLDAGVYYQLHGVASSIWSSALGGLPLAAMPGEIERHYVGCEEQLAAVVEEFVHRLLGEGLLSVSGTAAAANRSDRTAGAERIAYRPPALDRYTDLEELLRADPIHEIVDPDPL